MVTHGRVLVLGASSRVGREVVRLLVARGHAVRAVGRARARLAPLGVDDVVVGEARRPEVLARAVDGCVAVVSCLGASVRPAPGDGWRGYGAVDAEVHRRLAAAIAAARVPRAVYLSVFHDEVLARTPYVRAHLDAEAALEASGTQLTAVRPTGFASAFAGLLPLAKKGPLPEIGDGRPRTNPIDDLDVAALLAGAVDDADAGRVLDAGGPEELSRHEILAQVWTAAGRTDPLRVRRLPAGLATLIGWMATPLHPRLGQLFRFFALVSTRDCVAPVRGARRLGDALTAAAATAL